MLDEWVGLLPSTQGNAQAERRTLADSSLLMKKCSNSHWPYSTRSSCLQQRLFLPLFPTNTCARYGEIPSLWSIRDFYLLLRHILSHEYGTVEE
jgi:hypothetical protein